jgi:hypothetical protein
MAVDPSYASPSCTPRRDLQLAGYGCASAAIVSFPVP